MIADDEEFSSEHLREITRTCVRDVAQADLERFPEYHEARAYYEQAKANIFDGFTPAPEVN